MFLLFKILNRSYYYTFLRRNPEMLIDADTIIMKSWMSNYTCSIFFFRFEYFQKSTWTLARIAWAFWNFTYVRIDDLSGLQKRYTSLLRIPHSGAKTMAYSKSANFNLDPNEYAYDTCRRKIGNQNPVNIRSKYFFWSIFVDSYNDMNDIIMNTYVNVVDDSLMRKYGLVWCDIMPPHRLISIMRRRMQQLPCEKAST